MMPGMAMPYRAPLYSPPMEAQNFVSSQNAKALPQRIFPDGYKIPMPTIKPGVPKEIIPGCEQSFCKDAYGDSPMMLPLHGHELKLFDPKAGVGYAAGFTQTGLYKTAPIAVPSAYLTKDGFQNGMI